MEIQTALCNRLMLSGLLCLCFFYLPANNIQISNVSLTGQNTTSNTYQVKFDISWENSWRTSTFESNYDAAWIFIKFKEVQSTNWSHATILEPGFVAPAGSSIDVTSDGVGAFIFRSADGIGPVNFVNAELRWNYGSLPDDAIVEIKVMAIEMVYIPQGAFSLGDITTIVAGNFEAGNSNTPFQLTSENSLTLGGTNTSNLSNHNVVGMLTADDYNYSTTQTLPATYPKGYNAFYIQKYEISQGQYAAFLNNISTTGATNRFPGQFGATRHTINNTGPAPEIYVATVPDRACNFLSWSDQAAYADWSGLRPMSELEYEKACRGPRVVVPNEFAWGNANIANAVYTVVNDGQPDEVFTNMGINTGNALYISTRPAGVAGPYRTGILAASAVNPTRQESGASYYGVMELSGNIWELFITTGKSLGRNFRPNHGNGIINTLGESTVADWPPVTGGNTAIGTGVRGGANGNPSSDLRISARRLATLEITTRFSDVGGRLVRSSF